MTCTMDLEYLVKPHDLKPTMASYPTITVSARDDLLQLDSAEPRPRIPELDIMDSFQSDLVFETGSL